ncbi:DUF5799 family protein [Halobacterium yunchengense]|uniref:DUF5799 family protein n=1 Tax=Halobacterium yunchengense TaxID=3108497 RepID=UPI00300836CA
MTDWTDQIVGARMTVDQEFAERVRGSSLSNSQWGLVMTAVEFDLVDAGDPERARIVADTSKLEHVLPEMQNVDSQMAGMGGGAPDRSGGSSGGVMGSIKDALGLGGGGGDGGDELADEARQLADEYAEALQSHLESAGRWDEVRRTAAGD